jgi:hypothetical protein
MRPLLRFACALSVCTWSIATFYPARELFRVSSHLTAEMKGQEFFTALYFYGLGTLGGILGIGLAVLAWRTHRLSAAVGSALLAFLMSWRVANAFQLLSLSMEPWTTKLQRMSFEGWLGLAVGIAFPVLFISWGVISVLIRRKRA